MNKGSDLHNFLFELGTEELPDNVIVPAISNLKNSCVEMLSAQNLSYEEIRVASSPRRLAICVTGLPEKQSDIEILKTGPSVNIAYTESHELSKAGQGFLRKSGGTEQDVFIQKTEKGEFMAVSFVQQGLPTSDIMRDWLLNSLAKIPLPKKMIWKNKNLAFSRPIRWIVALWDSAVIEMEFEGIKADRITFGNRYLGLDRKLIIEQADSYFDLLSQNGVVADRDARKEMIRKQFAELFDGSIYKVKEDERLLDTVCNLIEHPCAVMAEFDASFLSLPEKIITSTISQNQKYFSVYGENDILSNKFVFVSNGDPKHSQIIRAGNEKVVAARLEDAIWFFQEDTRRKLDSFVPHLKDVVFQSRLGTLYEKTVRIEELCARLADELAFDAGVKQRAIRTAHLCKADLVTLMLAEKEFTKLQGYMGMQYALAGNEEAEVALGIYEHYMPRGSNDALPESISGALCAIADKVDTVCGIIAVGLMPTGSADPFALRRAAGGVVQILADRGWNIDLEKIIDTAFEILTRSIRPESQARDKVKSFFAQRVSWLLKELDYGYDVVASVMHDGFAYLPHLIAKARALQNLREDERFIRLVIAYKRVSNIIAGESEFTDLDPGLFESEAEHALNEGRKQLQRDLNAALAGMDYSRALLLLVDFGVLIDKFFEDVLVNCEESSVRQNRYALLNAIREEFMKVADISLIVIENDTIGE